MVIFVFLWMVGDSYGFCVVIVIVCLLLVDDLLMLKLSYVEIVVNEN